MPPSSNKTNFKTYEAQARLVRAIVAAHPEMKWNFPEILKCFGSDMTKDSLNHRFRRWRSETVIIQEGQKQGFDIKDMVTDDNLIPKAQNSVDTKNIAKYFGQSTGAGIEFHFRSVKTDAKTLRGVAEKGGDVANALGLGNGNSAPNTPSKPTPSRGAAPSTGKRVRSTLPKSITRIKEDPSSSDGDGLEDAVDFEDLDIAETPSKRAKSSTPRPPRSAAPSATPTRGRTPAPALTPSLSRQTTAEPITSTAKVTNEVQHPAASIFGSTSELGGSTQASQDDGTTPLSKAFRKSGKDSFLGSQSSTQGDTFTGSSFSLDSGEI